jgi:hypothetical protein
MLIIETPTFSKMVTALLNDEDYRILQHILAANPEAGDIVQGGGGIRKIRFALPGKGKRGGVRVIYYWQKSKDTIFMLIAYIKSKKSNLTTEETTILKRLVKEIENG